MPRDYPRVRVLRVEWHSTWDYAVVDLQDADDLHRVVCPILLVPLLTLGPVLSVGTVGTPDGEQLICEVMAATEEAK